MKASIPRLHLCRAVVTVLLLGIAPVPASADIPGTSAPVRSKVYLQISPDGREDLDALFRALEDSVAAGEHQDDPVVIVLHGPEAEPFIRRNYLQNRAIVDRAAKLRAFNRIELRMCETWMRLNGYGEDDLLPFVDTVPLAPAEVERLERDGYIPYEPDMPRSGLL